MEVKTLNRQIAVALGYRVNISDVKLPMTRWACFNPQGEELYAESLAWSEEEAWENMPAWECSLDAVIAELPSHASIDIGAFIENGHNTSITIIEANGDLCHRYGSGATRQESAARALLDWLISVKFKARI
jgi:hypothetical protein